MYCHLVLQHLPDYYCLLLLLFLLPITITATIHYCLLLLTIYLDTRMHLTSTQPLMVAESGSRRTIIALTLHYYYYLYPLLLSLLPFITMTDNHTIATTFTRYCYHFSSLLLSLVRFTAALYYYYWNALLLLVYLMSTQPLMVADSGSMRTIVSVGHRLAHTCSGYTPLWK